ncbi:MAG: hypothetical protein U0354_01130, partial [Candidatus Sericytochromatia bacterium]
LILFLCVNFSASCGINNVVANKEKSNIVNSENKASNPDFELLIEQKKTNGELIPIGSKGVGNVSINDFDYPVNKLIQDQSIIQIPNLVAGKHDLKVLLYLTKSELKIPLVIPNISQKIFVILRVTINENTREVSKIEYGYDLDRNGIIDSSSARFESTDNKTFYAISTSGVRTRIDTQITSSKSIPNEDIPPPGVIPQANTSLQQVQPQQQISEPPKPGNTELYPQPPSVGKVVEPPIPLQKTEDEKKEN